MKIYEIASIRQKIIGAQGVYKLVVPTGIEPVFPA